MRNTYNHVCSKIETPNKKGTNRVIFEWHNRSHKERFKLDVCMMYVYKNNKSQMNINYIQMKTSIVFGEYKNFQNT